MPTNPAAPRHAEPDDDRAFRHDGDADDAPAGSAFAHMAGALQAAAAPAAPRAPQPAHTPAPAPEASEPPLPADAADALRRIEALILGGQGEQGLALSERAWPLIEATGDAFQVGVGWHLRAVSHEHAGRLKEGMLAGYKAIAAFEQAQAWPRLVRALSIVALILAQMGDAPASLDLLERAVQLLPRLADAPRDQGIFWLNAAASYQVLGDLERAVQAGETSVVFARTLPESDSIRSLAIGHLLAYRMEREERTPGSDAHLAAIAGLRAHMATDIAAGRLDLVPFRAETCAGSLIKAGALEEARDVLRVGIDAVGASGNQLKRGPLEMRLAEVERLGGQFKAAGAHIALALELITQGSDQRELELAYLENSRLQEAQQRWRSALDSFKRHAEIRDTLQKSRAALRAQALMARVEIERSRVEAELLRLRNAQLEQSVTRLADEAGELKRQALEDPLTGLANRRMFDLRVQDLRAGRTGVVLMLGDVDHFKRINDTFSHATGDAVLRAIGALLRQFTRPDDLVARFGGEEFVVAFASGLALPKALEVAERLRVGIRDHHWAAIAPGMHVTMSLGLSWCRAEERVADALARADQALYACKAGGRDQVRSAD